MFVFVEESAGSVMSTDAQAREVGGLGGRAGQCSQGTGIRGASVGSVRIVVAFVLAQGV
ncbi:hypothetical protein [Salinispora arenicola]|uniref:hypothetical protein n=1 Tax=Salinispora arenicola TaxID=168697 RepID=UPI0003607846|nr:hypothetical protein [Salinispora arenicola]